MKNNYAMNVSSLGKTLTALAILTVVSVLFPSSSMAQMVLQSESLEGTIFPAPGWKNIKGPNNPATNVSAFSRVTTATGTNPAPTGNVQPANTAYAATLGANCVMFNSFTAQSNDDYYLISKPFDFSNNGGTNPEFSFWMYRDALSAASLDKIEVYWNNTPTTTGLVPINHGGGTNIINRPTSAAPVVGVAGWYQYTFVLPAGTYNTNRNYFVIHGVSAWGQNIYLDKFECKTYPSAMINTAGGISFELIQQNQATTAAGNTNQMIVGVRCVVDPSSGCGNLNDPARLPVKLDELLFNTNGTSNVADIINAKIYYTGGSNIFSTGYLTPFPTAGIPAGTTYPKTQFGSTLTGIGTNMDFGNPAAGPCFFLEYDTTYFWLTYDIAAAAAGNNFLDADFRGATTTTTNQLVQCPSNLALANNILPVTSTLTGAVQVDLNYCTPNYTVGTAWAGYTNNDYVNSVQLTGYGGTQINTTTNAVSLQLPGLSCYPNCNFVKHPPDYEYRSPSVPQQSVTLQQGAAYSITVQVGTWFSNNNIRAWIDFNHNGTFDPAESLGSANLAASGSATWPFTVPPGPGFTGNTRLRVREVFAVSNPDPCAQYTYGECEDFVVTIIPNCSGLYKLWLGNNNDWNNPANWCPSIPTINDDVMIDKTLAAPSGTYYNPVIKSGVKAVCKNITIALTDTLSIDAPGSNWSSAPNFKVKGSVTNNGQIKVTTSYTPSITIASGTLLNFTQTPFPGKTYKAAQVQIIYTAAELLGYGMVAGDQISAIKLDVKNNDLGVPIRTYNSFSISYLNSAAVPNAFATTVPVAGGFTSVYTNAAQPITFGINTFSLGTNIIWDGVNNIVLQYCYTNPGASPSANNDYINYTQTTGRKSTLVLGRIPSSVAVAPVPGSFVGQVAADIAANGSAIPNVSNSINLLAEFRPNATFVISRPYGTPRVVVQGNWINNNSFLAGTSQFIMNSYKTSRIGGTNPSTFFTFMMNKSTANTATVTSASGSGVSITYTAANTFAVGNLVEVTGLTPAGYNMSGTITAVTAGSFTIAGTQTGASSGTGLASVEPSVNITSASSTGTAITYTAANTYAVGNFVEISGLTPSSLNIAGIVTAATGTSFTLNGTVLAGTYTTTGTAVGGTGSNLRPIIMDQNVTIQDTFKLSSGQMIMNGKSLTMTDPDPSAFYRLQVPIPAGSPTYTGTGLLISENPNSLVRWAIGNYTTSFQRIVPFGHRVDTAAAAITFIPFSFVHTAGQLDTIKVATKYWGANALPDPPTVTHIDTYNSTASNAIQTADRYWMIGKVGPQNPAANFPVVNFVMRYNNSAILPLVTERPSGVVPAAPTTAKAQPWMAGRLAWLRISANATLGTFTIPIGGVSANGTTITYTTSVAHTIVVGQGVTMTGIAPAGYNIVGGTVIAVTANTFTIANPTSLGASTVAGTVAVAPSGGATAYNLQQTTLSYTQGLGALGAFDSVRVNNWDWPIVPASGLPYNNPAGPIGDLIPWTITNNSVPLPIELVEFKAKAEGKRVRLDWTTASEIDNDYFTVERSTDVKEYSYIDRVSSYLHNSNIMLNYTTYDEHPLYGLQYYRLKQTDFNGEYTYSEPRAVWFGSRAPFDITNVYGEASSSNNINVDFMYNSNEPVTVIITDAAGRLLFKEDNVAATKGENSIKLNSSLPHGLYFISLKNSDDVVSRKFVY